MEQKKFNEAIAATVSTILLQKGRECSVVGAGYHQAVREAKRQVLLKAIEKTGGNLSEAARNLGIHPNNLHRLLRDLDLRSALKQPQKILIFLPAVLKRSLQWIARRRGTSR